jgi:DNA invertase Pin-like site-specific DNA recombinase
LDLQLKVLKKVGCQKIFREKVSGFLPQRPEFERMLDQIRPGDTIVVWRLDRLAHGTASGTHPLGAGARSQRQVRKALSCVHSSISSRVKSCNDFSRLYGNWVPLVAIQAKPRKG